MTKILTTVVTAMVLLSGVSSFGADITERLPADTILIGKVDLAAARGSRLGEALMDAHLQKVRDVRHFCNTIIGFDPDQVKTVWLVSSRKDTGVVALQGTFSAAAVRAGFGGLPNVFEVDRPNCEFAARFKDEKKPGMQMGAVLDRHTMLVGDEPSVERFLAARSGDAQALAADDPEVRRIRDARTGFHAVMRGNLENWGDFDANMARWVKALRISGQFSDDVSATLSLTTVSPDTAEGLGHLIRGLTLLTTSDAETIPVPMVREAIRHANVEVGAAEVRVTATLNGDDVQRLLAARR